MWRARDPFEAAFDSIMQLVTGENILSYRLYLLREDRQLTQTRSRRGIEARLAIAHNGDLAVQPSIDR